MPCDSCGHSKAAHKEMTLAVYFCNQCQKVESYVSFPPDRATTGEGNSQQPSSSSSYEDMLSQLYYEKKAFRKN